AVTSPVDTEAMPLFAALSPVDVEFDKVAILVFALAKPVDNDVIPLPTVLSPVDSEVIRLLA
uniref:hypothetical protein n=1 Tax=Sphingomonas elodea TaxID=179878 RepID=UPI0002630B4D